MKAGVAPGTQVHTASLGVLRPMTADGAVASCPQSAPDCVRAEGMSVLAVSVSTSHSRSTTEDTGMCEGTEDFL